MASESAPTIEQALIDLYLNVKVRNSEEIATYSEEKLDEEREALKETDPLVLIEYVKTSIEILLNLRDEDKAPHKQATSHDESILTQKSDKDPPQDYEQLIQKLEAEVRNHIRVVGLCNG